MTAESLLRGAHASAVLEGSRPRWPRCGTGEVDEVAADAVRVSTALLALAPLLDRRRCRRSPGSTPSPPPAGPSDARPPARRRVRRPAPRRRRLLPPDVDAPALLVAAVVHAEVATAAPFASHNGIVARAVERLVLVSRGVDAKSLVVPEAGHLALRAAYESNLRAYRDGGRAGSTPGRSTRPRRSPPAPRPARCGPV